MKNISIILVVIALVAAGWYVMEINKPSKTGTTSTVQTGTTKPYVAPTLNDGAAIKVVTPVVSTTTEVKTPPTPASNVVALTIEGGNFKFSPSAFTVKKGQTVTITFHTTDGFHDFVINEFKVRAKQIKSDASETISFVADKAGTFEYYCSVGQHRAMGMKGTLTVTE